MVYVVIYLTGYPKLTKGPVLTVHVKKTGEVYFTCKFDQLKGYDVKYNVSYIISDVVVSNKMLSSTTEFVLTEDQLTNQQHGAEVGKM